MKVSNKTIDYLKGIISGDSPKTKYQTGPKLISFFSNFWFKDTYGQGFPSRWMYTEQKLTELNNIDRVEEAIEFYYKPINLFFSTLFSKLSIICKPIPAAIFCVWLISN